MQHVSMSATLACQVSFHSPDFAFSSQMQHQQLLDLHGSTFEHKIPFVHRACRGFNQQGIWLLKDDPTINRVYAFLGRTTSQMLRG